MHHQAMEAVFRHKVVLISVNKTYPRLPLYDAVRYSWKISCPRAEEAEYVLAVNEGVIIGAFEAKEWLRATKENFPDIPPDHGNWSRQRGRFGFYGSKAPQPVWDRYLNQRVPDELRHHGNPIRYVGV